MPCGLLPPESPRAQPPGHHGGGQAGPCRGAQPCPPPPAGDLPAQSAADEAGVRHRTGGPRARGIGQLSGAGARISARL